MQMKIAISKAEVLAFKVRAQHQRRQLPLSFQLITCKQSTERLELHLHMMYRGYIYTMINDSVVMSAYSKKHNHLLFSIYIYYSL